MFTHIAETTPSGWTISISSIPQVAKTWAGRGNFTFCPASGSIEKQILSALANG